MHELVEETVIKTIELEFTSGGGYFDRAHFEKEYAGREEQKQNFYERSKRHECPIRGVTLYQNPSYSEFSYERTKPIEERKHKLIQDQQIKRAKPKAKPKAKE